MAADKKPAAPEKAPAKEGGGAGALIGAILLAVVVGGVVGGAHGFVLAPTGKTAATQVAPASKEKAAPAPPPVLIKDLPPIVGNLGSPKSVWLRLEASFAHDASVTKDADKLAREIADDLLAYLATLPIEQVEGAAAFAELRAELDERAALRSGGRVKKLYLQTLVIQ
jgi:flagellar FliL protein